MARGISNSLPGHGPTPEVLKDRISPNLRKHLRQHNVTEGLGQLADHTCCDIHWNANLRVAAIEHHEETEIVPMAILRARRDIEKDSEILKRYWHKKKDAWQNKFECECCACTNHTETTTNPMTETVDTSVIEDPVLTVECAPRQRQDIETLGPDPSQTHTAMKPDSELDNWDWDTLEASPPKGNTTATQQPTAQPPPTMSHEEAQGNLQVNQSDHQVDTLNWDVLEHPLNTDTKTKLDNTNQLHLRLTCAQR